MKITYKSKSIEKVCTNANVASKKYGYDMAGKIQQRIDEIKAADNVEQMIQFKIGRCHPLKGSRKNQYAVDLIHPKRLVFIKIGSEIQIANIIEIVDYH
ncbi:MAG: type II toxin-antitoxin system RelE/ParE family toxin [Christensenellales bacterium]|nr:plasmid maintenance system killer protein [Clostridiales bacterium]